MSDGSQAWDLNSAKSRGFRVLAVFLPLAHPFRPTMAQQQQQVQQYNNSSQQQQGQSSSGSQQQQGGQGQSQQQEGGESSKNAQDPHFTRLQNAASILNSRLSQDGRIEQATELSEVLNCQFERPQAILTFGRSNG